MDAHQERVIQSFRRVQGWFGANTEYTATNGPASTPALTTQLVALNGVVDRVTDHATQQGTQFSQSLLISKDEHQRRLELRRYYMAPIVKVARALRGTVPGIGVLAMPKANILSAALFAEATVMARKAEIYRDVLVENGLAADCVEQLEAAAEVLKESLDARGLARAGRSAATRGLEAELAVGQRIVAIMDAVLTGVLRNQPAKLAEWQQLKRVTVKGVSNRQGSETVESSPTPVESSPTVVQGSPTAAQMAA